MSYKFKLNDLDCVNCANKIEKKLLENINIINARVDFNRLTIYVETNLEKNVKKLVNEIVNSVEPNTKVLEINEKDQDNKIIIDLIRLLIGIFLMIVSCVLKNNSVSKILIIASYIVLLYKTCKISLQMLIKGFNINENLLVTISCIGAFFTNNTLEGLMVIILYETGKILEKLAVNNSRKSISDLMNIKPEYANLKDKDRIIKKNPEEIKINEVIVIKQGEKIPLDGIIVNGSGIIDTSSLTGESEKRKVKENDLVYSGSINENGLFEVKVLKKYENSTVSNILNLVENASSKKANIENVVSKYAKIYTPIIIILALFIALIFPILFNLSFETAIYRALVFLVVSCPCAIAISVPLSYFSGIGSSSKKGILIKGSEYLDAMSTIKEIIFDKTGTITNGKFKEYELKILDKNYKKSDIIKFLCLGEKYSNHPIAKSILNIFDDLEYKEKIESFKEISGMGISYILNDKIIKIGSSYFCSENTDEEGIFLNINNNLVAKLVIFDSIKEEALETINNLKKLEIKTKMLTGDSKEKAIFIANKIGIEEVNYELLPTDKYNLLENEIEKYKGDVAFIGDGINDAPSLALAKVGIAMGGIGSDASIEAADIVIMNDNLKKILDLLNISKKTKKIIKQNLIFAFSIKTLSCLEIFL